MDKNVTLERIAWGLAEASKNTGLSVNFLRKEIRSGLLRAQKKGRRVLILDEDLRRYLSIAPVQLELPFAADDR